MLAATGAAALGLAGCASLPEGNDPRMHAELSRVLGVPESAYRWIAAVDWSVRESGWQPSFGVDLFRGTFGMLLGDSTSTGVLTDDALVIARAGHFSISFRVLQRIPVADIDRVTLLGGGIVAIRRRGSGELRDYVRVLVGDPWLADELIDRPSYVSSESLVRTLRARIHPSPARWCPPVATGSQVVALLVPRAPPAVTVPPPPGLADKGPVSGTGGAAKALLQAGEGLGTLSPPTGLPLGLAALVVGAVGSAAGALHGALRDTTDPRARAAKARLDTVQASGMPRTAGAVLAHRLLIDALAERLAALPPPSPGGALLVPVDEAEIGAASLAAARAALAEDGFAEAWQLRVAAIDLNIVSAFTEPTADPLVRMHVEARLQKSRFGEPHSRADDERETQVHDAGDSLPLSTWMQDDGARLRSEFTAACTRLAAQLADGPLAGSRWLGRP